MDTCIVCGNSIPDKLNDKHSEWGFCSINCMTINYNQYQKLDDEEKAHPPIRMGGIVQFDIHNK